MEPTKLVMCTLLAAVVAVAGFMAVMDEYVGTALTVETAVAQSTSNTQTLAQEQEMTLRFPPGQYFYYSDSQINGITQGFVDRLPPFDITKDNAVNRAIIPTFGGWVHEEVTQHFTDPSLAFRYITLMLNAGYDATAPYHPTAVGVYSRVVNLATVGSEPDIEGMNVASFHAAYQLMMKFDPDRKAQWDKLLTKNNLNPNDIRGLELDCWAEDPHEITDPVIIGNFAGKCVWEGRANDGFNHTGEETNGYPFMDTTGYAPVNSANVLVDPSRWQPQIVRMGEGEYVGQQYITPQWANTEPYTPGFDPRAVRASDPTKSSHVNMADYKEQADEVIEAVAGLDDRKKILAEYFDNKARGTLFFPAVKAISTDTGKFKNTMEFWQLDFMLHVAEFDAGIAAWQEKTRYDAVRPITAIQHIYGDDLVPTYDDKNPSTPMSVPASEWKSYVNTGNHPEYPSATTCFCAAEAQVWRNIYADDNGPNDNVPAVLIAGQERHGFSGALLAKSSIHERGITPAEDISVTFNTWTEFVNVCAESRIWSGVHFRHAVEAAIDMCTPIGDQAYAYFQTLMDGTAPMRGGPDQAQPADPMLDRPHFTGRN